MKARSVLGLRPAEAEGEADPSRHCERSEAIHLKGSGGGMDCFVASLLATTTGDTAGDPNEPPLRSDAFTRRGPGHRQGGLLFLPRALLHRASLRADVLAGLARRGSGGEASGRRRGKREAARRQRAAAAPEVARRLGRPAGVAPRPRSDARHRQRHLRPGPLGQVRPRLPRDHDLRLVPVAVCDQARLGARAAGRAHDLARRLSAGDLGRRRHDRPRRRRDPDRRPPEARRRDVAEPPRRRQRLVRFDALFAAQRQAKGRDRHRHAAPARGRSRRPRLEAGRLGRGLLSGGRRRGRGARHRVRRSRARARSGVRRAKRSIRRASRYPRSNAFAPTSAR